MPDIINIGLFGFGTVGYKVYEILEKSLSIQARIKTICVRNPEKKRPAYPVSLTYDATNILHDPDIQMVIELMDDAEAAFEVVSQALKAGKSVITANKKMIALHFEALNRLQAETQAGLLYEAACCASIPIIRCLETYYSGDIIQGIRGIMNGSSNYILNQMELNSMGYEYALQEAQQRGYAESNPYLDVSGKDACYKLSILCAHAFGHHPQPEKIFCSGISNITMDAIEFARSRRLKIKMVAQAYKVHDGTLQAIVIPQFIDDRDPLYTVADVENGVQVFSALDDEQFFRGEGAGATPTAAAVIRDIAAIQQGFRYANRTYNRPLHWVSPEKSYLDIYLLLPVHLCLKYRHLFEKIYLQKHYHENAVIMGRIRIHHLRCIIQHTNESLCPIQLPDVQSGGPNLQAILQEYYTQEWISE